MEITEVRVKLVEGKQDKLKAFCSITIDDAFVVRDLKIIEGTKGLFVAMPSRKLTVRCSKCGAKNQMKSNFCGDCGYSLPPDRGSRSRDGRQKMHADIAHPINSGCREAIQTRVLESFLEEIDASQKPGYQPRSLEEDLDDLDDFEDPDGSERSHRPRDPEPRERDSDMGEQRSAPRDRRSERRDHRQDERRSEPRERRTTEPRERHVEPRERRSESREQRDTRKRRAESRESDAPPPEESSPANPKKSVEPDDPPPDDNFGVGIF